MEIKGIDDALLAGVPRRLLAGAEAEAYLGLNGNEPPAANTEAAKTLPPSNGHLPPTVAADAAPPDAETDVLEALLTRIADKPPLDAAAEVLEAYAELAQLPSVRYAQAKLKLKAVVGRPLNLNDLDRAVGEARRNGYFGHGREAPAVGPDPVDIEADGIVPTLAKEILAHHFFAVDAGGILYAFSGGVYTPNGERFVARQVKSLLTDWGRLRDWGTHDTQEVTEFIRTDAPELWERPPIDEINLKNGILNVVSRELREHDPDFLTSVQLPIHYDPSATCPHWERFLTSTFPADAIQLAYEIPADLITPDTSRQKATLLKGEGRNGKSTYLRGIIRLLGRANVSSLSLQKLETDRFGVARLVGKLANICPDLPSTHLENTSIFKLVTGEDVITGEHKHRESFDFFCFARLLFSTNHFPRSGDASEAFFRRWNVLPFDKTFEEGGPDCIPGDVLDAQLAQDDELSGLLNKALDVLPRLRTRGFSQPESVKRANEEFRATTDPLAVWLDANTVVNSDAFVICEDLRLTYNLACEAAGRPKLSDNGFGRTVSRVRKDLQKAQRMVNDSVKWVYLGIGLKSDKEPPSGTKRSQHSQHSQDSRTLRRVENTPPPCEPDSGLEDGDQGRGVAVCVAEYEIAVNPVNAVRSGEPESPVDDEFEEVVL
jgi:P4 family phage/plasmid primase-like protien